MRGGRRHVNAFWLLGEGGSRGERKSLSSADAPALETEVAKETAVRAISASARLPSKSSRKCLYEAPDGLRDRLVLVRRAHFRQYIGVCEHVEAERSGERSAINAEPANVFGGRLLDAEAEEVPSGEGLEVFDLLHVDLLVLEAGSSALRY